MTDIITRCPQCNTAFRVTQNQLAVADGVVRCGSCLAVFKAADNKQANSKPQTTATKKAPTKEEVTQKLAQPTPSVETHTDAEELISDQDDIIGLDIDDDIYDVAPGKSSSKNISLFDRKIKQVEETRRDSADESWAVDMLADLDNEEIEPIRIKRRQPEPAPEPFKEPTSSVKETSPEEFQSEALHEELEDTPPEPIDIEEPITDTDWLDEPLDTPEPKPKKKGFSRFFSRKKAAEVAEPEFELGELADKLSENAADVFDFESEFADSERQNIEPVKTKPEEPTKVTEPSEATSTVKPAAKSKTSKKDEFAPISDEEIQDAMESRTSYAAEPDKYVFNIEPAPVEMEWYETPSMQTWLWRVAALVLGITLIAQVAYFKFDSLAKSPTWRPYYSTACSIFGCTLPSLIDTNKIRTTNLIVRSNPNREGALIVDAILINSAPFSQPYPALRLAFSDLNENLVAARNLQPREYLRGELAGSQTMEPNQPIQVSLNIVDPGDNAVNYQLEVFRAQP